MITRLNATDEAQRDANQVLGSRIIQVLWRFSSEVPTSALQNEWNRLNQGPLSRIPKSAWIPGARRKWIMASNAESLREYRDKLGEGNMPNWIDEQIRVPLPVDSNVLWRLAATPHRHGSLVSLTVPHFRSDGLGVFAALGTRRPPAAHRRFTGANQLGSDLGDALRQITLAIACAAQWGVSLLVNQQERSRLAAAFDTTHGNTLTVTGSGPRFFSSAIFDIDATSWNDAARARGGTANSLFVEIAANLARARLPHDNRTAISVGIPVSLRQSGTDNRANAVTIITLNAPAGSPQHDDLSRTRRDIKELLQRPDERRTALIPEPMWHMLPRRYAQRLKSPGDQHIDVIASNFGRVPHAVNQFTGQEAEGVAVRVMNVPGLVPERGRLRASLCMLQNKGRMTITTTGMPDEFGDADSLRRLVTEEFSAWGLQSQCWC